MAAHAEVDESLRHIRTIARQLEDELAHLPPEALDALMERLSADELETICFHPAGNRSARWYAQQRAAEIAFHRWDLLHSLGREAPLDEALAAFLLPMLLERDRKSVV